MPRYIDANLIEKYVTREDHGTPDERWRPEREFCAIIDSIPTADVQEVKHGHWVLMERGHYFKCSECRTPIPYKFGWKLYNGVISNKRYYNFCPNCGAKMFGGSDRNRRAEHIGTFKEGDKRK